MDNTFLPEEFRLTYERIHKVTPDITINQYKRSEVMSQLLANMRKNNTHMALLWAAELHMSSFFDMLMTRIIHYYICERNGSSPHILNLITEFLMYYIHHMDNCPTITKRPRDTTYSLAVIWANDQKVRNFLGALIAGVCASSPRNIIRIPSNITLDMSIHRGTLLTKDLTAIKTILKDDDPTEIIIPLSEIQCILNRIDIRKRPVATEFMAKAVYWLGWLATNEKAQGKTYMCRSRPIWQGCSKRHYREWVKQIMASKEDINKHWSCLVWEIIFNTRDLETEIKDVIGELYHIWIIMIYRGRRRLCMDMIITAMRFIINPMPFIEPEQFKVARDDNWRASIKSALSINYLYKDVLENRPITMLHTSTTNEFGYD